MTEARKEVLRHGSIVSKLLRIVANEVPARKLQAANLSQHCFSIHRLKVFLLGLVRTSSKRHLTFDHRDRIVSQADLIAGVDDGSKADSRSVGQIPSRHISSGPDGCIEIANAVVKERIESAGSVGAARSVAKERTKPAGGVDVARGIANERIETGSGSGVPRSVGNERIEPASGVAAARGVAKEPIASGGGILATRGVAIERTDSAGGVIVARGVAKECFDPAGGVVATRGVATERTD